MFSKVVTIIFVTFLSYAKLSCQTIGMLINSDLSVDKKVNGSIGTGLIMNWPLFEERFDFQLSSFLTIKNDKLIESDTNFYLFGIVSSYSRIGSTASALYVIPISNTMKFKAGLSVSYNYIKFSVIPIPLSYIAYERLHSIGPGIRTNYNFKLKENSKLSFDLIFDTTYLIKIHDSGSFPENSKLNNTFLYTVFVSTPFFEPVINWKFKFAEISLSISKGLNYLAIDVDDLSCNLPSIAKTALLVG
jgi:hypothetical protein